jgi:hypothetical protein
LQEIPLHSPPLHSLGHGGSLPNFSIVTHETAFVILWYWFIFVCTLTMLQVMFWTLLSFLPSLQPWILHWDMEQGAKNHISKLLQHGNMGMSFQLYLIKKNENVLVFEEFLQSVVQVKVKSNPKTVINETTA